MAVDCGYRIPWGIGSRLCSIGWQLCPKIRIAGTNPLCDKIGTDLCVNYLPMLPMWFKKVHRKSPAEITAGLL